MRREGEEKRERKQDGCRGMDRRVEELVAMREQIKGKVVEKKEKRRRKK